MERYKPVGWRNEPYRHYLAAKGVKTTLKGRYQKLFPQLVKSFPDENPRITENYARFRQRDPGDFKKGSFRTKKLNKNKEIILGEDKKTGKYELQSVLINRKNYFAARTVKKKGRIEKTKSGAEVRKLANSVYDHISPYASKSAIVGSIRRGSAEPVDIDVVLVPKSADDEMTIRNYIKSRASEVYQDGREKLSVRINGIKTEVIFSKPDEYGAQKLTFTGPFGANIYKRKLAKERGWLLNQRGLFDKNGKRIATTERQIYEKLNLTYREPSLRGTPRK